MIRLLLFRCPKCRAIFGKSSREVEDHLCKTCMKYTVPVHVINRGDGTTDLMVDESTEGAK